jgi:endoglucanase
MGPNVHPGVHRWLIQTAAKAGIKYALEIMPTHSGTDAIAMQVAAEGIPTGVIGIPLRSMHTAVETVALADIQSAGRLLAEGIGALDDGFLPNLRWE